MERFHVKVAEERDTVQLFAERMTKLQTLGWDLVQFMSWPDPSLHSGSAASVMKC